MPDRPAHEVVHSGVAEHQQAEQPAEQTFELVVVDERVLLRKIVTSDPGRKVTRHAVAPGGRFIRYVRSALRQDEAPLTPEEAAMSAEIDRIIARLDEGIPKLHKQMDDIQARLRRPVAL